jgi:hypothetical protein
MPGQNTTQGRRDLGGSFKMPGQQFPRNSGRACSGSYFGLFAVGCAWGCLAFARSDALLINVAVIPELKS